MNIKYQDKKKGITESRMCELHFTNIPTNTNKFSLCMNNFYAQHQNMMSLLVRSSNAPDSNIKCLALQYTTHTHTHTLCHHAYTVQKGKCNKRYIHAHYFMWDWMRICMLHVVTVHKQTCKFFRLTQVVWTCIAIVCICRSMYRWGGPAHTSAFFSLSKAHSGCKRSRRERQRDI